MSEAVEGVSGDAEGCEGASPQDAGRVQPHPEGLRQGHAPGQYTMDNQVHLIRR